MLSYPEKYTDGEHASLGTSTKGIQLGGKAVRRVHHAKNPLIWIRIMQPIACVGQSFGYAAGRKENLKIEYGITLETSREHFHFADAYCGEC